MRIITHHIDEPICDVEECKEIATTAFTAIKNEKESFTIAKVCEDNDHFVEIAKLRDSLVSEMEIKNDSV